MPIAKKLILLLIFILISSAQVFATIVSGHQEDINMRLDYPLVYLDDKTAQDKINTDIAQYVEEAKADYYNNGWHTVILKYDVKYEDDHILSIVLTRLRDGGGAHPLDHYFGMVYNKDTGDRVPISNFVNFPSVNQWKRLAGYRYFPAYNWQWKRVYPMNPITRVSDDYYLTGHGVFYMIYQSYEFASSADGIISIEFNPSNIDYLNRLNNQQ